MNHHRALMAPEPSAQHTVGSRQVDHEFHGWSAQEHLELMPVAGAGGSWFWDEQGRRYLDFASQAAFANIGHQHPRVIAAIQAQAAQLCTVSTAFAAAVRTEAARLICACAPDGVNRILFTTGGAEAVDHAVRMARIHTGRPKVLASYRSYHGSSGVAISATGDPRRWPSDAASHGDPLVRHFIGPDAYRSPFHADSPAEESERALDHLEQVIAYEGPDTISSILLESVPNTSGVLVPPPGYLAGVRALCDRHKIVYIADEVATGFGRTGAWFGIQQWNVTPDLITVGKGINAGTVPLGGVLIGDALYDTFRHLPFPGGLTYAGHLLACAAAVATLQVMREEQVVEHAAWLGQAVLGPGLREIAERHRCVGQVRGLGVMWALELVKDRQTREMLVPYASRESPSAPLNSTTHPMNQIARFAAQHGVYLHVRGNRIHLLPPCTLSAEEARVGLAVLDQALGPVDDLLGTASPRERLVADLSELGLDVAECDAHAVVFAVGPLLGGDSAAVRHALLERGVHVQDAQAPGLLRARLGATGPNGRLLAALRELGEVQR